MTDELKLNMAEKLTAIVGKDRVFVDEAMSRHTTFKNRRKCKDSCADFI